MPLVAVQRNGRLTVGRRRRVGTVQISPDPAGDAAGPSSPDGPGVDQPPLTEEEAQNAEAVDQQVKAARKKDQNKFSAQLARDIAKYLQWREDYPRTRFVYTACSGYGKLPAVVMNLGGLQDVCPDLDVLLSVFLKELLDPKATQEERLELASSFVQWQRQRVRQKAAAVQQPSQPRRAAALAPSADGGKRYVYGAAGSSGF